MNILLFTNSFLPQIGGREIVVHYLAREYARMGHNVRVVKPGGFWKQRRKKYPYKVHNWPIFKAKYEEYVYFCIILAETFLWPTDIIHVHNTYPCGYVAAHLKKISKIPLIITPHGADINIIPEMNFGLRLDPYKNYKIRQAISKADALTAISKGVANSIIDAGCNIDKLYMIPNGIDLERFAVKIDKYELYKWLGIEEPAKVILTVGNYRPLKGQEIIVKAMPNILKKEPMAKLVIVGKGTEALKSLIKNLGLKDYVLLTGQLPIKIGLTNNSKDWLAALYEHCSIYVSASVNKQAEGLSLSLLDALAAAKPIVATNITGNCDVVENNKNGILVEPGNSVKLARGIIQVISNSERCKEFGNESYNKAKNISWNVIALKYLNLYNSLLQKRKR